MNIKKAFSNSLLSLLNKKPLSKITIGDLLEDTELSRQTFYEQASALDGQNSLKEHMLHHCIEFDLKWHEYCIGEPLSKELRFATLYHTNASHSMVLQWILEGMKEPIDELVDNINHMRYLGLKDLLKDHCPYR